MSADVLRRAAALMRERANGATLTADPWDVDEIGAVWAQEADGQPILVSSQAADADAAHIASWHPAVALKVAAWLEAEAAAFESIANFTAVTSDLVSEEKFKVRCAAITVGLSSNGSLTIDADTLAPALDLARTYLGEVNA